MQEEIKDKNYYEILEANYDAGPDEIYHCYLKAKKSYSGESVALYSLLTEKECSKMLDQIELAYSVLSVPTKRSQYDQVKGINKIHPKIFEKRKAELDEKNYISSPEQSSNFNALAFTELDQFKTNNESVRPDNSYQNDDHSNVSRVSASKRFKLDYKENSEMEQKIENMETFSGEALRNIREYKNVSIPRMAELTKISKTYIRQIENDEISKLPAIAYVRGFVYQYAKVLKLSPNYVATSYINYIKGQNSEG